VSGITVSDESALGLTAFFRGVTLISRTLGGLPPQVFQEEVEANGAEGQTLKLKTPETGFLWRRPNPKESRQTFWERIVADEVRGNAFIWVEKHEQTGAPIAIYHIARRRMRVGQLESGQKIYEMDNELPMIDYRDGGEIVHIPNWGEDIIGYDPVKLATEAIALGLSAQEYAARSVVEGGSPPGLLTSDLPLTPEQAKALSARWEESRAGLSNRLKAAVLGNGAKFQQTSVDPEKMQLESLRKFQSREIATLLGLPPHVLSDVERSTSWGSGIEEQNRNLFQFNFQAHLNAVEQAATDDLLVRELTGRYMRFNVAAMLRGTTLQRNSSHAMAYGRWMTANEIRALEELPPVEGGDDLLAAANMVPADQLAAVTAVGNSDRPRGEE